MDEITADDSRPPSLDDEAVESQLRTSSATGRSTIVHNSPIEELSEEIFRISDSQPSVVRAEPLDATPTPPSRAQLWLFLVAGMASLLSVIIIIIIIVVVVVLRGNVSTQHF